MEKTLTIDGKEIRFKSNAATPIRYRSQFGSDYFSDLFGLAKLEKLVGEDGKLNVDEATEFDSTPLYRVVWVLAKTADNSIPDLIEWLEQFEEFPLFEIFNDLQTLITKSMQSKKK